MVSQSWGEHAYATLLLNDSYLPGALVLAHSLRDAGTTKKLAVLVTLDTVTADAIVQLKTVYDYVIPVPRIRNDKPANLFLMNRADLHSAFTKINLWKQTQFSKIVYIDADIVAYRAPDELFELPCNFAAAPDIGWPDIFNTGVMVLKPDNGDFHAMSAMTDRGISFDGADQGLLNIYFKDNFHRLPFTYNVTPSAHYQYLPAYRHFQSSINMVHFIGTEKPWRMGRNASYAGSAYDEMVGRWWAVYDRHYHGREVNNLASGKYSENQYNPVEPKTEEKFVGGRFVHPDYTNTWGAPKPIFPWEGHRPRPSRSFGGEQLELQPQLQPQVQQAPLGPQPHPEPQVQKAQSPAQSYSRSPEYPQQLDDDASTGTPATHVSATFERPGSSSSANTSTKSDAVTSAPSWTSYSRTNAWDEVPEINRYVEGIEKRRRSRSRSVKSGQGAKTPPKGQDGAQPRSLKLTDFPTEVERPSLPVTPAPVARSSYLGDDDEDDENDTGLPTADGVPVQSEWDPRAQLDKLARLQSETLLRKLGGGNERSSFGSGSRAIPARPLPFGSERARAPQISQSVPDVLSPRPVKGTPAGTTTNLERKTDAEDID